ncbi:MAG: 3-dehydroquinate synthase, partial [Proteobacteria bacterium]|nr:3-dehydroquinate synthase [Pseudomonadota bacterium]
MQTVVVNLGDRTYPIHIGSQLIDSTELVAPYLARSRVVIVSNDVVAP